MSTLDLEGSMATGSVPYRYLLRMLERLVEPLRVDETMKNFTLAIPDAQTTTVDSVEGWANRPPAVVRCTGCEAKIPQRRARSDIDCPNCYRVSNPYEFADHELLALYCPRCTTEMDHGIRHPNVLDIPEWATCPDCQYHWDLDHWF